MKRAGFTMIELIFVIVILGILAAVALPKFIGVSEQAHVSRCSAFVGTLNRTVGPAIWSDSIARGLNGDVVDAASAPYNSAANLGAEIEKQITVPENCGTITNYTNVAGSTVTVGQTTYDINFTDGNATTAPVWGWQAH